MMTTTSGTERHQGRRAGGRGGRSVRGVRSRAGRRLLAVVLAVLAAVTAAIGLTATSSAALNGDKYGPIPNAERHRYCLDIDTGQPVSSARAQLWDCHNVPGQRFIRGFWGGSVPDAHTIRVERGDGQYCLTVADFSSGAKVGTKPCFQGTDFTWAQAWWDNTNGVLVNPYTRMCLDASSRDQKGSDMIMRECDDSIAQRWFL